MHVPTHLSATACALAGCPTRVEQVQQSEIDGLMGGYAGAVPGASLLVIHHGVDVVRRGYGLANLEEGIEAGPATNYRLASVSKQFTAAAVLLLVQDGRLRLDHHARSWLPSLPSATRAITLRQLLSHTSGLIDYEEVMPAFPEGIQLRDADVLHLLETHDHTHFAAGSRYRYSNSGYALLALIVERASGRSFPEFLRQRIFLPLGMHETLAHVDGGPPIEHRAYGYSSVGSGWTRSDQGPTSAVLGDGGIYSSLDDLARWDAALYDDRLLEAPSRAAAFAPATATDDPGINYGFGWRISGDSLWHSGESIGFRNVILRYPAERLSVILLSNRNDPEPARTARQIARLFRG